jgi:hypothetical protein
MKSWSNTANRGRLDEKPTDSESVFATEDQARMALG